MSPTPNLETRRVPLPFSRPSRLIPLAVMVAMAAPACLWAETPPATTPGQSSYTLSDDVETHIRSMVDQRFHPGMAIGWVDGEGERFFSFGVTAADGDPVTPDTLFEIGSISKVFNGLLLADLAAEGRVGLDAPVARYLPEGAKVPEKGRPIHLVDLATHTSGLPRLPSNMAPANNFDPYVDYGGEQLLEFLASHELGREVGAKYEYSNLGAGLLGFALAEREGKSWEAVIEERITGGLGMKSTAASLTEELEARFAQGHSLMEGPVPGWAFDALAGAGALRSTARDMVTFLSANLGFEKTRLLAAMELSHGQRVESDMAGGGVALGWHLRHIEGATVVWHNGGTGGFRSFAGFVPEKNVGVVILTNTARGVDGLGFHLLVPTEPLPETPKKRKIPLFAKD